VTLIGWLFASGLGRLSGTTGFDDGVAVLLGENKRRVPSRAYQGRGLNRGSCGSEAKGKSYKEGKEFHANGPFVCNRWVGLAGNGADGFV